MHILLKNVYGMPSPVRTDCRPYSQSGPKRLEYATSVTMYAAGVRGSVPPGTSRQAHPPGKPSLTYIYNKVPSKKVPRRVRPEPPWNGMKAMKRVRIPAGNARKRAENVAFRPQKSPRKPRFPPKNRLAAAIITKNDKFISLIFR